MMGRFDENGDLWIEVNTHPIPHGVVRAAFTRVPVGGGVAVIEINLTAYIADLVDRRTR